MQNADFGQILSRRASTKSRVTSRPMVRFSQTWYQKMRKTLKKKVIKRCVAISGGRDAVTDFVQGGVKLTPPPVKIGLKLFWLPVVTEECPFNFYPMIHQFLTPLTSCHFYFYVTSTGKKRATVYPLTNYDTLLNHSNLRTVAEKPRGNVSKSFVKL